LAVLGEACSRVRGHGRFVVDCRSGSCGARWEPDGPGLHGGSKRRLSLQSALQDGSRKSAHVTELRGWAETKWRVRDSRGKVRAARQQTFDTSEIDSLIDLKAVLCLGQFAFNAVMRMIRSKYNLTALSAKFGHGRVLRLGEGIPAIICSYHPSPRNTQTGKLTEKMFLSVMRKTFRKGKIARNKP